MKFVTVRTQHGSISCFIPTRCWLSGQESKNRGNSRRLHSIPRTRNEYWEERCIEAELSFRSWYVFRSGHANCCIYAGLILNVDSQSRPTVSIGLPVWISVCRLKLLGFVPRWKILIPTDVGLGKICGLIVNLPRTVCHANAWCGSAHEVHLPEFCRVVLFNDRCDASVNIVLPTGTRKKETKEGFCCCSLRRRRKRKRNILSRPQVSKGHMMASFLYPTFILLQQRPVNDSIIPLRTS